MRQLLALAAGAATAAIGAQVLGEYELAGVTAVVAGTVFGLVVSEVVVSVGRRQDLALALATAVLVAAGLVWAAWIWTGRHWSALRGGAWLAVGLGVAVALVWVAGPRVRDAERPGDGTSPDP